MVTTLLTMFDLQQLSHCCQQGTGLQIVTRESDSQ